MSLAVVVCTLAFICHTARAQSHEVPVSPCPAMFAYLQSSQKWIGAILVPSASYGTENHMRVTMSLGAALPSKYPGSLRLLVGAEEVMKDIARGAPVKYMVQFPLTWPIPKLTGIYLNEKKLCSGPGETFHDEVNTITDITLEHTIQTIDPTGGSFSSSDNLYSSPPEDQNYQRPTKPRPNPSNKPAESSHPAFGTNYFGNTINNDYNNQYTPIETPNPYTEKAPVQNPVVNQPVVGDPLDTRPFHSQVGNNREPATQNKPQAPSPGYECGVPNILNHRIVGGSRTSQGVWPWIVAMYLTRVENLAFHCPATLVSNRHVITTAVCTYDSKANKTLAIRNVLIRLGVFNLQDWADEHTQQVDVSKIVPHPQFNKPTFANDIAVLVLASEAQTSDYIIPICLWDTDTNADLIDGRNGTVIGWGRDENGVKTLEPRVAEVPVVTTERCLATSTKHFPITSHTTLCAGGRDNVGPCNGDAGAGVYILKNRIWYLRGVVSLALSDKSGVCDLSQYVVLTDTAKFLPWIYSVMT